MQSSAWLRRAAIVAVCLGATATVGVASAAAATKVPGENIYGSGSSLQAIAQTDSSSGGSGQPCSASGWRGWVAVWACTAADQSTLSNPGVTATYTVTSSGVGLAEWGNAASSSCAGSTAGVLDPGCDPTADAAGTSGPELDAFVGTDDPPSPSDLSNAETAAGNGVQELTIPVTQAPVAMIFSLPTDITVAKGQQFKVTTAVLANLWGSGGVTQSANCPNDPSPDPGTWCDFLEALGLKRITSGTPKSGQFLDSGTDEGGTITLMERSKGSGTTYSFRGWLYEADQDEGLSDYPYSKVTDGPSDWPTTAEPQSQSGPLGANGSGGNLVDNTADSPGSTGYANLADAALDANNPFTASAATTTCGANSCASHQILYALVQDNTGDSTPNYASPASGTGTVNLYTGADIGENVTTCTPPASTKKVGCWVIPGSPTGSWSSPGPPTNPVLGTIPSDPDVYDHGESGTTPSKTYPVIAVTYDLAWTQYDNAGSNLDTANGGEGYYDDSSCPSGTNCNTDAGDAVKSYMTYLTGTGQTNLASGKVYYGKLPSAILTKAKAAVAAITP